MLRYAVEFPPPGSPAIIWSAVSTREQANDDHVSLEQQIADGRAVAEKFGWVPVDTLVVPGFSRSYLDLNECADDMERAGIPAFRRLIAHWRARDFRVLICLDGSRFARTQSLFARVAEETVLTARASIYPFAQYNLVHAGNLRDWISLNSNTAAGEVQKFVHRTQDAMDKRILQGLPGHGNLFFAHRVLRNDRGRRVGVELRDELRGVLDAAAGLLLAGVPYTRVGHDLAGIGYVQSTGRPYSPGFWLRAFHNPAMWGHAARHWYDPSLSAIGGLWALDARYEQIDPLPDGALIARHVLPAAYPPEQAEPLKAEIVRRRLAVKGRARPHTTRAFSGLVVCGLCGRPMHYATGGRFLYCAQHATRARTGADCPNPGLRASALADLTHRMLSVIIEQAPEAVFADRAVTDAQTRLSAARDELARTQQRIDRLLSVLADAPESAVTDLVARLTDLTAARDAQAHQIGRLEDESEPAYSAGRSAALEHLHTLGVAGLMNSDPAALNRALHALLGPRLRFSVAGAQITLAATVR